MGGIQAQMDQGKLNSGYRLKDVRKNSKDTASKGTSRQTISQRMLNLYGHDKQGVHEGIDMQQRCRAECKVHAQATDIHSQCQLLSIPPSRNGASRMVHIKVSKQLTTAGMTTCSKFALCR